MSTSPMARLILMGALLMALLIPLTMMYVVVSERTSRRDAVANEMSSVWGGPQVVTGPILMVPYRHSVPDTDGRIHTRTLQAFFLPETLEAEGTLEPEIRRRTLFEVVVYRSRLTLRGRFPRPDPSVVQPAAAEALWSDAVLSLGVSDPRGLAPTPVLTVNGAEKPLAPGIADGGLSGRGLQARIDLTQAAESLRFELQLVVNGTRDLKFVPAGNETAVRLRSSWPHPSFGGAALPESRRVDRAGFEAAWRVSYFGRGFPSHWTSQGINQVQLSDQARAAAFGVALIQPVDIYQQTERALKYAALFIVLTFVVAFLWEISGGVLVHPVQYLFVGFAMCLFYLLLLSVAEHFGFDAAYAIASACTVTLLAWYWSWVLRGARQGWIMGSVLATLYGYLYLLLRLEDYALLSGSIGLFLTLALLMFLTRRVDWYSLRIGQNET